MIYIERKAQHSDRNVYEYMIILLKSIFGGGKSIKIDGHFSIAAVHFNDILCSILFVL